MDLSAEQLAARADQAERLGRTQEAAEARRALAERFPDHPLTLFFQGRACIERGDPAAALPLLARAEATGFRLAEIPMFAALAHRMRGELQEALAALDRALAIDPYFFLALLSKGAVLEQMGRVREAAPVYKNALKIAPPPERLPPAQRSGYVHAQEVVRANNEALRAHLLARTAPLRAARDGPELVRFDECLDILAGVKPRQMHDPILLYYPRLPPIPFFDRSHFPWLEELEAATDTIREELAVVWRDDRAGFTPYIQYPKDAPKNQWAELDHSCDWSTYFLWRDGRRYDDNCARCPRTAALLERLPLARQAGYGPTAMFSALAPHKHIPPHTGSSNARLIVHLPLVLPGPCRFRVGNETRPWRMGEAWVFDDSIDHEAWNDADETRIILIFDVWNPLLSEAERELVTEMMLALNEYQAGGGGWQT